MPLANAQTLEIRFPSLGVDRRRVQERVASAVNYPTPWAVNCRLDDNLDRRLRGGSRPGLTKFVATDMGATIADIAHLGVSRSLGASDILVVLVDSAIKVVEGGVTTTYGSAPSAGFLVTGQQHAFAVTASAIVKVNPKTGSIANLSACEGTIPTNCTFGAVYRDRLCLAGEGNAIYMSRQGDYTDWSYGTDLSDSARAVLFQLSLAADTGPLPTAVIAHKDKYLLAASARTLWVVRGDVTTGELVRISENVGIIDSRAWCKIEDQICFLAEDGIYRVSADGSDLTMLSDNIPAELRDVDTSTVTVRMGYEHDRKTIWIFLRTAAGSDTHWTYELAAEAWWPVRFTTDDHSPLAVAQHQGELLLAGADGYLRRIGGDNDDGVAISSHVVLGPIRLGPTGYHGIARSLHAVLAQGSGSVAWRFVTGDTADEASDNAKLAIEAFQAGEDHGPYVKAGGSVSAGRSPWAYPRVRSYWLCLWVQSSSKWAFESIVLERTAAGRWR